MENMKLYVFGKLLDPELKKTSTGKSYLRFTVYAKHNSMTFDVFETVRSGSYDNPQYAENPLFKVVSNIPEAAPVMVDVYPSVQKDTGFIKYFLNNVFEVTPSAQQAINGILLREPVREVTSDSGSTMSRFKK